MSENDMFNELLIAAALDERALVLFRSIFRYLLQTGLSYGLTTFVDALRREHGIARELVNLFGARHDPNRAGSREENEAKATGAIIIGLERISAIDEVRMLRLIKSVIMATLRTNFFAPSAVDTLTFKLDNTKLPGLPAPLLRPATS